MFRRFRTSVTSHQAVRNGLAAALSMNATAGPSSSLHCMPSSSSATQKRRCTTKVPEGARATNSTAIDDDDFVDILFPGEEPPQPSSSASAAAAAQNASSAALAPSPADDDEADVILGIQRDEPLKDNEVMTRLGKRAVVASEADVRVGTRAAALQGREESNSGITRRGGGDEEEDGWVDAPEGFDENAEEEFEPDEDLKGIELPYDDAEFAEAILQMEVEGQLDESWQNQRTAKKEDCAAIVDILKHMKTRDICCIDVSSKTSSFDYMIFATCEGPRHVHLCSWSISSADKAQRLTKPQRKTSDRTWEAVPVGRIIVNLMVESYRNQMSLERKWTVCKNMDPLDAANAPASEGRVIKAHGLWTLTLNLQDLEDFEVDYCKDALLAQL